MYVHVYVLCVFIITSRPCLCFILILAKGEYHKMSMAKALCVHA